MNTNKLMVLQNDGTMREATLQEWKEHAQHLEESAANWREIADLERDLSRADRVSRR